jgi:colanic acid biosynthesis glycosyl transferase WcaI
MKLNVTVWGINYRPELVGISPHNTTLCQFLAARGHSVRMVTAFPYYPSWSKLQADRGRLFRTDNLEGVRVHRCWHYVPKSPSAIKRILHEGSFVMSSFLRLSVLPRPDILIVISPPLLLGAAAWLMCCLKRAPFIFHVKDLQPDAAVGMGMLKRGALIRALYRLEAFAYSRAHRLSGLTRGMTNAFKSKGVSPQKIIFFPDAVHLPDTLPPQGAFRRRLGLDSNHFLAVYSGNLGVKQGLEVLIEAARLLRDPRIRIIICGDGARRKILSDQLSELKLANVLMLPLQPSGQFEEMLADADLTLITQQKDSGACFFPSKILTYLAFAKPVLTVADSSSELAIALNQGGFGLNVEPGNPSAVAETIQTLADDPERLRCFSSSGSIFVKQFESHPVHLRFEQELFALLKEIRPSGPPPRLPTQPQPASGSYA